MVVNIIFWGALTAEIMTVLCIPQRHIIIISSRSCIELRNSFTRIHKQNSVLLIRLQTNFVPLLMIQKEALHLNSHRTRISCIHQSLILVSSSGATESISSSIFYSSSSLRNKSIPGEENIILRSLSELSLPESLSYPNDSTKSMTLPAQVIIH